MIGLSIISSPFSSGDPTSAADRPWTVIAQPAPEIIFAVEPSAYMASSPTRAKEIPFTFYVTVETLTNTPSLVFAPLHAP